MSDNLLNISDSTWFRRLSALPVARNDCRFIPFDAASVVRYEFVACELVCFKNFGGDLFDGIPEVRLLFDLVEADLPEKFGPGEKLHDINQHA